MMLATAQLTMGSSRPTTLPERVATTPGIVVLCAPPGFGKSGVLGDAEKRVREISPARIRRIDAAQNHSNPAAAAEAVLSAGQDELVIVDTLRGADPAALSNALAIRFSSTETPRLWIAIHRFKELSIARLTLNGSADIIDWRSFRLTDAETRARIERVPARFRKLVLELSGSWPAATSLLCRWAQQAAADAAEWDVATILAASGLDQYVEQEIAPLLSDVELDALVHASVAESIEIDPDKRGVARAAAAQAIASASVTIAGLVERHGTFLTLHPALRHWLAVRFEALPKERQLQSLAQAAREFAGRGNLVVAARLFRSASMEEEIERVVVERGSLLIWLTHGFSAIREIVAQAGDAAVSRSPVLQLMRCIVLMKMGRISEAQALFAALDDNLFDQSADLERDREIVRVALLVYGCGLQRDDEFERFRVIVARTAGEPDWKSLLATFSCLLHAQRARFDAALASLIEARTHARSADSQYNLMFLSLHEANIRLAQGELKKARVALGNARKRWRHGFADDRGAETVMCALAASLEYELGQITSARASVRRSAYRMPDSEAWFDIYAAAYEPMARIIAADHGPGPAQEALADQRRKLVAQGLPRVAAMLQNLSIVLAGEQWIRAGGETPGSWDEIAPVDGAATWQEQEAFILASAYARMKYGDVDRAAHVLRAAIRDSDRLQLARSNLRYRLLLTTLLLRQQDGRAGEELRRALLLGVRLGARQVFLHTMSPELSTAITELAHKAAGPRSALKRFVGSLHMTSRTAGAGDDALLSAREIEVLRALSEGGSDKVIGRVLDMTEHGVRFHLKSIYRKLNVHDRLSAVHRAKELGAF
jgi:LuxR family maltose regulon positive regulatory protein